MGALPARRIGMLLVGTRLRDRSMGTLCSPGTQPADHRWFLMTEYGNEQVNHEAVMGVEQSVLSQHTPLSKISPWPWAVSVVMGIPSVKREVHSYLTDTLNSLISELTQQEKEDSVIVVLIAEVRQSFACLFHFTVYPISLAPIPSHCLPNSVLNRTAAHLGASSAACRAR